MVTIAKRTLITTIGVLSLVASMTPGAQARTEPPLCRVRNVTQDTTGRSFVRMVGAAADGDRLHVRGSCRARDVVIDADVVIRGVGAVRAVLHARGSGRVLLIRDGATVGLDHLRITGGAGRYRGGGIHNRGDLVLTDSVVRGNRAGVGGGIWNLGVLRVVASVVRANEAGSGGGIAVANDWDGCDVACDPDRIDHFGSLSLTRSVVRDNTARRDGGGVASDIGRIVVTESSVIHNTAGGRGGGIHHTGSELAAGHVRLRSSTVASNTAGTEGGGVWSAVGALFLRLGTTVTANTAGTEGGGIWVVGFLMQDEASSVSGNSPDDSVVDAW